MDMEGSWAALTKAMFTRLLDAANAKYTELYGSNAASASGNALANKPEAWGHVRWLHLKAFVDQNIRPAQPATARPASASEGPPARPPVSFGV